MNPADHFTATIGEDPFALVIEIEKAAKIAGRLRADANHAERVRKVKLAEAERAYRAAHASDAKKPTIPEVEAGARTSPMYAEHLDRQRELEVQAAEAEASYYALRNRQDWLHKAADAMRAEAYLSR